VLLALPLTLLVSILSFDWKKLKIKIKLKLFLLSKTDLAIDKNCFLLSNNNYTLFADKETCSLSSEKIEYDVSDNRILIAQKAKKLYDKGAYFDMSEEITEEDCK
jgi:hypothetical protein